MTSFNLNHSEHFQNDSHFHSLASASELYDVPVGIVILLSLFYGSISIIAVVGNSLVIWIVATTRQMQTITNLFIANLALADVVIGMFAIPFQFQAAILQRWNLPEFMCAFCPFVQMVSVNVSVFTLTAIAVDRHRAIINPLRARPPKIISKIVITFIWIISLVFAIPIAIALEVTYVDEVRIFNDGNVVRYKKPFCDNVGLSEDQMRQYRYYLVFVQYVIPFCVISFVYIQMAIRLWGSKTPGNAQDTRDVTLMRNKKRVIKMLIIVVLLFGLCWFPLQLYNILQVTWQAVNEYRFINIVWFCSDWLAMSNSCYNPFIYGIYNEKFKREFRRRFPLFRLGFDPTTDVNDKTVSMYTRASSIQSNCMTMSTRNKIVILPLNSHHTNLNSANNHNFNIDYNNKKCHKNTKNWTTSLSAKSSSNCVHCQNNALRTTSSANNIDWNQRRKHCDCLPQVIYQHITTTPPANKKLIYHPINVKSSTNCKCCCNKTSRENQLNRHSSSSCTSSTDIDKLCDKIDYKKAMLKSSNINSNIKNYANGHYSTLLDLDALPVTDEESIEVKHGNEKMEKLVRNENHHDSINFNKNDVIDNDYVL